MKDLINFRSFVKIRHDSLSVLRKKLMKVLIYICMAAVSMSVLAAPAENDEIYGSVEYIENLTELKPSFAWIDDDGREEVYTYLYPWAVENNVPVTSALVTQNLSGVEEHVTYEQMQEMYESGMVTFGSHTRGHVRLSELSSAELEYQIKGSKEDIESYGVPCDIMVYPYGSITDEGLDIVRENYDFGVVAGGATNSAGVHIQNRVNYSPISTYRVTRIAIDSSMDDAEIDFIKEQIDEACENNGLVIFMSHVGHEMGVGADEDIEIYTEIVEYIRDKGYDIEPVLDVLNRFKNPVEIGRWSSENPDGYFVVGADGTVNMDSINGQVITEVNKYTGATLPDDYPQNQITSTYLSAPSAFKEGLPVATRGLLTAYMTGSGGYRIFMPSISPEIYLQIRKSGTNEWKAWVNLNDNYLNKLNNDVITSKTTPYSLPGGINICLISKSENLSELPEGKLGYMTTYKISTNAANAREEWQPVDSVVKYVRLAESASKWGPWYKFEPVLAE